jgi:DNA uptake protein ComE-like DNA-binding protein
MRSQITAAALAIGLLGLPATAFEESAKPAQEQKKTEKRASKGKLKLVDLNTATESELRQIPGVDAKLAKKIIANRPYITVDDLAKSGIPAQVQETARMRVTVTEQSNTGTADRADVKENSDQQRHRDEQ